jgi:hypothetical protein
MEYRVYCLDSRGKISKGEWLQADTLEAAIEAARETCGGQHFEIWDGARRLAEVPATPTQAPGR